MADERQDERNLRRLRKAMAEDVLADDYPASNIDDELRADGADPTAVGRRFAGLVKGKLDEHRRLAWMERARADLDRMNSAIATMPRQPKPRDKAEAMRMLARLRADPRAGGLVTAAFRKKGPEATTEAELIALVEDVHKLLALPDDPVDDS